MAPQELKLPDTVTRFSFTEPGRIAVDVDRGIVAVTDEADEAIHVFDLRSHYVRSIAFRGPDRRIGRGVTSLSFTPKGDLIVANLANSNAVVLTVAGRLVDTIRVPLVSDSVVPGLQVAGGGSGGYVATWLASSLPTWSKNWFDHGLPLLMVLDRQTLVTHRWGKVRGYPGVGLTAAMNRGYVAEAEDTAWFAEAVTANVHGVAVASIVAGKNDTAASVRLPLFFPMARPLEYIDRSNGMFYPRVEYHLTAFAVSSSGHHFYVGQVISWPAEGSKGLFLPQTALVVYDRVAGVEHAYRTPGRIFDVAGTDSVVFVIVRAPAGQSGRQVIRYSPQGPSAATKPNRSMP